MGTNSNRRQTSDAPFSDNVEELIRQMKDDRIQPNLMTYQYGIDCLSRMGEAIRAETLLANLVKDYFLQYDADLKPTITPFQSVLRAYSKGRRIPDAAERAESILSNMKELSTYLDTYPTVWSYNIVMKCWSLSRSKNSASRTMALYEELRQSSSSSIYNDNEGIDCRQDTNDKETFDITAATNLKPEATTINTTLNVFSINKSAVQTEKILWEFYERHIQEPQMNPCPDRIAFTTTIMASRKAHFASQIHILSNAIDEGAEPVLTQKGSNLDIDIRDDQIIRSIRACFARPGFIHSIVAFSASGIVVNTLSTYMDYLVRIGGSGRQMVGIVGGLFQLIIMISSMILGQVTDKTRRYHAVIISLLVLGAFALAECGVSLDASRGDNLILSLGLVAIMVGPLQPIATELGVEIAFPLSENTVLVIQQLFSNLLSALFIPLFQAVSYA